MNFYRIVVAYDGTAYRGWQEQNNATTVSSALTKAFKQVFFQEARILGASRTDAGVHALGQVAIVRTSVSVPVDNMLQAWSKAIPSDITLRSIQRLDQLVHPHDGVVEKTYVYYIFLERPLPFYQRFGWYIYKPLNLDTLQKALNLFIGEHDFRSFCTGDDLVDTVRTVNSAKVVYDPCRNAYKIEIKGKSFLRYMIRRIVGACVTIATSSKLNLNDLQNILDKKNPCHTLPNAPAKGLVLEQIVYQKGEEL